MGTCWSASRPKVGTTPVLSGKAMYSYDNNSGIHKSVYEAAVDSTDSGAEVSEDTVIPSLAAPPFFRVKHLASQESFHSSADSFLSGTGLARRLERQGSDSLKAECGSSVWRYISPSPRSFDERNFADLSDDDMRALDSSEPSTHVTKIKKNGGENISEQKSDDGADAFWIPDTLARHMGIWNSNSKSRKVKLKRSADRIYANDEDIFMSVENNLGRYKNSDNVFAINDTSLDNSVTDFSYNSNEDDNVVDVSGIENDFENNNREVQLSVPSLIFIDNNTKRRSGMKKAKDWVSFDDQDQYNYEVLADEQGKHHRTQMAAK